jgi:thermostable 8-oxoguanine DNA glycosylase
MGKITSIDPHRLNEYISKDSSKEMIELFFFCCLIVAGKKADVMFPKAYNVIANSRYNNSDLSPFDFLKRMFEYGSLSNILIENGTGQYSKINNCIEDLIHFDYDGDSIKSLTPQELEKVRGIGPKTSRFFLSYVSPNENEYAIIDTHITKFLMAINPRLKKSTDYYTFEKEYLNICKLINKNPKEFDLEIWNAYSRRDNEDIANVISNTKNILLSKQKGEIV